MVWIVSFRVKGFKLILSFSFLGEFLDISYKAYFNLHIFKNESSTLNCGEKDSLNEFEESTQNQFLISKLTLVSLCFSTFLFALVLIGSDFAYRLAAIEARSNRSVCHIEMQPSNLENYVDKEGEIESQSYRSTNSRLIIYTLNCEKCYNFVNL